MAVAILCWITSLTNSTIPDHHAKWIFRTNFSITLCSLGIRYFSKSFLILSSQLPKRRHTSSFKMIYGGARENLTYLKWFKLNINSLLFSFPIKISMSAILSFHKPKLKHFFTKQFVSFVGSCLSYLKG